MSATHIKTLHRICVLMFGKVWHVLQRNLLIWMNVCLYLPIPVMTDLEWYPYRSTKSAFLGRRNSCLLKLTWSPHTLKRGLLHVASTQAPAVRANFHKTHHLKIRVRNRKLKTKSMKSMIYSVCRGFYENWSIEYNDNDVESKCWTPIDGLHK